MGADDARGVVAGQVGRARICIAESRLSISRSRERIDDSLRVITGVTSRFALQEAPLTDDQILAVIEAAEMKDEQGKIDREVRWTLDNAAGFKF